VCEHVETVGDALVLLGVVARLHGVTPPDLAGVGLGLCGEDAEQRRLAGPVQAHDEQSLTAPDVERHVFEHLRVAERLGQPVDREHGLPAMRWFGEGDLQAAFVLRSLDASPLELLPPGVDGLRGPSSALGLAPHRVGERPEPSDLLVLPLGERRASFLVSCSGLAISRVGPSVLHHLVTVEVQDARDRRVEQGEVVTHDEQGTVEPGQELHQPRLGVRVEVVRGLVEHEQVRPAEQDSGELEPATLPARERAHGQCEPVL
jgi:hypothetical protein